METNETKEQKSTDSNDQCTMKEGSKSIYIHEGIQFDKIIWNWIWKTPCPKKIQIFIWKCTHNKLLSRSFIA